MDADHCFSHNRVRLMRAIEAVARECRRKVDEVMLMAVSKTVNIADILSMYGIGQRLFGENRVQEAEEKFTPAMLAFMPEIDLHYIGTLQRNKVKRALSLFHCIQSIDSLPLLMELVKACLAMPKENIKTRGVFLQTNPLADGAKCGFISYDTLRSAFCYAMEYGVACSFLHVRGLMTIAPFHNDDAWRTKHETQKAFALTREWKERLETEMNYGYTLELSMGMSGDFTLAIPEQSTMVRVGTALFGKRL